MINQVHTMPAHSGSLVSVDPNEMGEDGPVILRIYEMSISCPAEIDEVTVTLTRKTAFHLASNLLSIFLRPPQDDRKEPA